MIFRLVEFEHSWKALLALWAFVCLVAFGFLPSTGRPPIAFDLAITTGSFWMLFPTRVEPRCALLQAALPIRARDLFASYLLLQLIICWFFNFTLVAAAAASHYNVIGWALDTSAVTTAGLVALHSAHIHERNIPRSWRWIIGLLTCALLGAALGTHYKTKPAVAPIYVLPACALAAVALFWIDWVSFPETFELASRDPAEQEPAKSRFRLPAFAGMPLLRAFASKGSIALFCGLFVFGCMGTVLFGIVFVFFSFFRTIVRLRNEERWLLLLPISRQKLFVAMILPPLGFFALGSLIGLPSSSQSPREAILNIATVAAASLLGLFVIEPPSVVRRLGAAWMLLLTCTAFSSLGWAVWRWCRPATSTGTKTLPIQSILGNALPDRLPLLIVAAVAGVAAIYWLAYVGFRRIEARPLRVTFL